MVKKTFQLFSLIFWQTLCFAEGDVTSLHPDQVVYAPPRPGWHWELDGSDNTWYQVRDEFWHAIDREYEELEMKELFPKYFFDER